jgi:hypothetical protein
MWVKVNALVVETHSVKEICQQVPCHRIDRGALPCSRKALPRDVERRATSAIAVACSKPAAQTRMLVFF